MPPLPAPRTLSSLKETVTYSEIKMNEQELTDLDYRTMRKGWHLGGVTCLILGMMHAWSWLSQLHESAGH